MINSFEEEIRKIDLLWKRILISSIVLIFMGGSLLFITSISQPLANVNGLIDPDQHEYSILLRPLGIFEKAFLFLGIIPLISTVALVIATKRGAQRQGRKPLWHLFQLFKITPVDNYRGHIKMTDTTKLDIIWNPKGYFELSIGHQILAYAKSTELYWKIIYFQHKFYQNSIQI
ncbi:MAG: hypothetical protein ACFFC7_06995 [Candidatus Hermodarchaeota archaeon]